VHLNRQSGGVQVIQNDRARAPLRQALEQRQAACAGIEARSDSRPGCAMLAAGALLNTSCSRGSWSAGSGGSSSSATPNASGIGRLAYSGCG